MSDGEKQRREAAVSQWLMKLAAWVPVPGGEMYCRVQGGWHARSAEEWGKCGFTLSFQGKTYRVAVEEEDEPE